MCAAYPYMVMRACIIPIYGHASIHYTHIWSYGIGARVRAQVKGGPRGSFRVRVKDWAKVMVKDQSRAGPEMRVRVRVRPRVRVRVRLRGRVGGSVPVATPNSVHSTCIQLQLST